MTQRHPLAWPPGWPRARGRKDAQFNKKETKWIATDASIPGAGRNDTRSKQLSVQDGVERVARELDALGVDFSNDSIISTNLRLRMDGLPRGDQSEPNDTGVAVYWQKRGQPPRVMAIDRYTRVADNLAAIAATLSAMRAIERHGGAQILERAFTGFGRDQAVRKLNQEAHNG